MSVDSSGAILCEERNAEGVFMSSEAMRKEEQDGEGAKIVVDTAAVKSPVLPRGI